VSELTIIEKRGNVISWAFKYKNGSWYYDTRYPLRNYTTQYDGVETFTVNNLWYFETPTLLRYIKQMALMNDYNEFMEHSFGLWGYVEEDSAFYLPITPAPPFDLFDYFPTPL